MSSFAIALIDKNSVFAVGSLGKRPLCVKDQSGALLKKKPHPFVNGGGSILWPFPYV
jgi:hypothetical protein